MWRWRPQDQEKQLWRYQFLIDDCFLDLIFFTQIRSSWSLRCVDPLSSPMTDGVAVLRSTQRKRERLSEVQPIGATDPRSDRWQSCCLRSLAWVSVSSVSMIKMSSPLPMRFGWSFSRLQRIICSMCLETADQTRKLFKIKFPSPAMSVQGCYPPSTGRRGHTPDVFIILDLCLCFFLSVCWTNTFLRKMNGQKNCFRASR